MRRAVGFAFVFVVGFGAGAHSFGARPARQVPHAVIDQPSRIDVSRPVPGTLDFETVTLHPYRAVEGDTMKIIGTRTNAGRPYQLRVEQHGRCFEVYAEVRD